MTTKGSDTRSLSEQPRRFLVESGESKVFRAKVVMQKVTSQANSAILNDLRSIVRNQVDLLRQSAGSEAMSEAQANVLMKLAKTYQLMNNETEKEQKNYDYSALSDEELGKIAGGNGDANGT